jgi:PAS domain S-box-containing protein
MEAEREYVREGKDMPGKAGTSEEDFCVFISEVFKHAPEAGVIYDPSGGAVVESNAAFHRLTGWTSGNVAGKSFEGFFADPDFPEYRPGEALSRRMMIRKNDGNWLPVDAFFSFLFCHGRSLCFVLLKDASDFIRLLESFQRSEERFRTMTDNCPMGMHFYRIESKGRLVFTGANPAADRILGIRNADMIGRTIEEAFPDLAATDIPDRYKAIAREGGVWSDKQVRYRDKQICGVFEVHVFQTGPGRLAAVFMDGEGRG